MQNGEEPVTPLPVLYRTTSLPHADQERGGVLVVGGTGFFVLSIGETFIVESVCDFVALVVSFVVVFFLV